MSAGNPYQTRHIKQVNNTSKSHEIASDPGKSYGIASIFFSMIGISLFGLVFGIIGNGISKKAGVKNYLAIAGIIISVIQIVYLICLAFILLFYR